MDNYDEKYGMSRVLEPRYVLPTSAWRLDNRREISPKEMRISLKKIHMESTNFKQLLLECGENEERLKDKIIDIVMKRGKLHNPMTETGGVAFGTVETVGSEFVLPKDIKPGDNVICNVSLASLPLYISGITAIDPHYSQIDVEGYAIVYQGIRLIKMPDDVPVNLTLYMLDQSGTLRTAARMAEGASKILLVGSNMMLNLVYGFALRSAAGRQAEIVSLLDKRTDLHLRGQEIEDLMASVFNEMHFVDILKPIECMKGFEEDSMFDLSVNCADIPGSETINVLAAKPDSTVIFANLINNYNISLYITEAVQKQLNIRCADGYSEGYEDFDFAMARALAPIFEKAEFHSLRVEGRPGGYETSTRGTDTKLLESIANVNSQAEDFICESRAMKGVLEEVASVSKYDCNVFITGDTGVGKEKVANIIQKNSARKLQPFVKVNCAAISPNLIESEFFGYEKGSFTGASAGGKKGYFEMADTGTIFLDEVGELPLDIQAKLLRVIQDGEFFRVGGITPVKTNVRILCATNRDIEKMVEEKSFRRDLYYRLNVFPIRIPALSERRADIAPLVRYFIRKYSEQYGISRDISDDALEYLSRKEWPGNIRELENVMQRLIINSRNERILLFDVTRELNQDLFEHGGVQNEEYKLTAGEEINLTKLMESYEKGIIQYACEKYGSTRKAAKAIGISQTQLVRKKNKYALEDIQKEESGYMDKELVNGRWQRLGHRSGGSRWQKP